MGTLQQPCLPALGVSSLTCPVSATGNGSMGGKSWWENLIEAAVTETLREFGLDPGRQSVRQAFARQLTEV